MFREVITPTNFIRTDRNCFTTFLRKAILKQVKRLHMVTKVLHKLNTKKAAMLRLKRRFIMTDLLNRFVKKSLAFNKRSYVFYLVIGEKTSTDAC